jgi:ankyrin repeat protein
LKMTTNPSLLNYFNKIIKYVVLYGFISSTSFLLAGSYEDFFEATQRDQVKVISNLLSRGFDPNTVNLNAEPAIFDAWKHESLNVLESLIKHPKTNLNVKNNHGESLLMLVCLKGNFKLAQLLVERQADINHPGWTPLHYAATSGNPKIIKLLLEESAYIDAESPNGTTPLMMAARYGSTEAVQLLIQEGADIHLKNQLGLNALSFAKDGGRLEAMKLIEAALAQSAAAAR